LQHCRLFSLLPVVAAAEVALVSPEPVVPAEAEVAVQLVVVEAERALVAEEAQAPLLSPALARLQTTDHRPAQPRLCLLQQCRPLCI
jgi:hypothetical protein